ncbi:hypothetical protein [Desulfolutivibrio sulfoxidireducens]|uniref:hypothetical protein n=1 Tax=Desulfolutivibrio sulfoxidireducens TaxID=2773299 RepID=UPI00159EB670|nr:hypothetical protein [Desulfolutivibrio sulfoxidireducens]QLA15143.1 hypothetical protein GD605_02815 [Desulfolutivibrio sulfoxidireducens]QLA18714.1 hypothetical protein GD604_02715 [Desulfolutivibrio sulfoxidireducens]
MEIGSTTGAAVMASALGQETFGAQVVTKTLDYMNKDNKSGGIGADYDFQTKVLAAGIGNTLDLNV